MSALLKDIVNFSNKLLKVGRVNDYCPNGLQVEGAPQVKKIIGGVTASQDLIDSAIEQQADAILVHHGYFWKGESASIVGMKRNRLKALLSNDISLIAYHLPLDMHPEVGNNAQLANLLGIEVLGPLDPSSSKSVGNVGELATGMMVDDFANLLELKLGRASQHIPGNSPLIKTVAWCTGAAQGMIDLAVQQNVDAYISGEISEPTVLTARETGVHYFAAGHHATEKGGVKSLGLLLAEEFDIEFHFVDIDNPV